MKKIIEEKEEYLYVKYTADVVDDNSIVLRFHNMSDNKILNIDLKALA